MVEVEQQQADLGAVAARLGDGLAGAIHQQGAVGQAGQGIVQRHVADARLASLWARMSRKVHCASRRSRER